MLGSQIGITNASYRGRDVPLAGERTFQPWTINAYNDTDFSIRDAFENWMGKINDVKENTGITNPMMYTSQLSVKQLDRNGATIKTYTVFDAWPTAVGDIQLDFGANTQIESFPITFVYTYWTTETSSSAIGGSIGVSTPLGGIGLSF